VSVVATERPTPIVRLWRAAFGPAAIQPLAVAQGVASIADAFVGISLAGSLFFNLSPDASRQQVLLYLIVAVSPLAVLAPLIGPTVDRFRHRQRLVAAVCYSLRAVFCVALSFTLYKLSFYGFALGLLIAGKASGIVKQALIPMLETDPDQLVRTNARLSRTGAIIGAVGGAIGAALNGLIEAPGLLRVAAVVYVCSAIIITRALPPDPHDRLPAVLEYAETHNPQVIVGSIGFMAIRAAVGFFVFTMAFSLRRESEPLWVYGAAVGIYGAGAFLGTQLAPVLRRRFDDEQLIAVALAAPAVPTVFGILGVSRPLLLIVAALIGTSTTLGRHGFDSLLQHRAPAGLRGRASARFETRFQLVWALGAVIATPITLPTEASMAVLAAVYIPAIAVFVRASRADRRFREVVVADVVGHAADRLAAAERALHAGAYAVAVVDAASAADLMVVADASIDGSAAGVMRARQAALRDAGSITADDAQQAIAAAQALLNSMEPRSPT
jgi:MFS family permease